MSKMITNGESLTHWGLGGQMLYVHPEKDLIVVTFSAITVPACADTDSADALLDLGDAIAGLF